MATVVSVRGEVSAENAEAVTDQVQRFILSDTSFVLDLSDLRAPAPESAAMVCTIDDACAVADIEWALVAGPALTAGFDDATRDRLLPLVDSVADALHDFVDAATLQRTLLLPMLQRSA
jgi:hypothetical protein